MRDATNIKDLDFYIGTQKTKALNTYITVLGEVYISLKHPQGGELNIQGKKIHMYLEPQISTQPIPEPQI